MHTIRPYGFHSDYELRESARHHGYFLAVRPLASNGLSVLSTHLQQHIIGEIYHNYNLEGYILSPHIDLDMHSIERISHDPPINLGTAHIAHQHYGMNAYTPYVQPVEVVETVIIDEVIENPLDSFDDDCYGNDLLW